MNCVVCGKPLNQSIRIGNYKSCPHCSQENPEQKHIFHPDSSFGTTPLRSTARNPDGIQSHCTICRANGLNISAGTPCDQII